MTEHPILFSSDMVRAILAGRKSQRRQVLNPQPFIDEDGNFCCYDNSGVIENWGQRFDGRPCTRSFVRAHVRHRAGDTLWVRESWRTGKVLDFHPPSQMDQSEADIHYVADGWPRDGGAWGKVRHSIHMPRWASRITLRVIDVRVERLQDISEADAKAEGVDYSPNTPAIVFFRGLRTKLYDSDAWDANPWVSVTTFERVRP